MAKVYLQYEESVSQISLPKVDDYLRSQKLYYGYKNAKMSHVLLPGNLETGDWIWCPNIWLSQGTLVFSEDLFDISPAVSDLGLLIDK